MDVSFLQGSYTRARHKHTLTLHQHTHKQQNAQETIQKQLEATQNHQRANFIQRMSDKKIYKVVLRSTANAPTQTVVKGLAITNKTRTYKKAVEDNGEDALFKLYEEVMKNTRAIELFGIVAEEIIKNTANATYKQGNKRIPTFDATKYALNAKTTEELLKEALDSAKSDAQASSSSEASDHEEREEPQQGDGVPTEGLPTVSDVQNHISPDIDNGTPIVNMDVDNEDDEERHEEEGGDEERSEKTMQSDVLCMVEDGEATVNDALAIYPYWDHKDDWDSLMSDSIPTKWKEAVERERSPASGSGVTPQSTSKRAAAKVAQRRLAVTTDIEPDMEAREDDGASSVEESDEEEDDGVSSSSSSSRKRKKRRSSGRRKRRKGVSMEDQLIDLHRKQVGANQEQVMRTEEFRSFMHLAKILLGFVGETGERRKYTLLNFLMIFIDAYSNAREGVVDKNFVSSAYKLSKCTMQSEEKQHKQLRQTRRGYLRFSDRYQSDDDFINFAFGERSTDDTLPLPYDRAQLKSQYKSSASNSKPIFVIVKMMLKKKNDRHLLEGIKKVMQNSFKEEYLDGKYATELLKIITDDDVVEFRDLLTTVLYYHYDDSEQFHDTVKHYHEVLSSNQSRVKLLFSVLDGNLERSRDKGASLVVRGSVVRDNVNLLFTMFQGKKVMMPHAWKSLVNLHLKQSKIERKQKVSPLTRDLFGHKMSFIRREEGGTIADARWASKAFYDGIVTHAYYLLSPYVEDEVRQPINKLLGRYTYVDHHTKSAVTSKFYSPWITAFITQAREEHLHFQDGIPDGRDRIGDFIQRSGSDSDSEDDEELTMKNLGTYYMDYIEGIIQLCSIRDDQGKDGVDPVLFQKINQSCKTMLITFVARYIKEPLETYFYNKDGKWKKIFKQALRSSLLEALQVKQGGSTKKKKIFIQDPLSYMKSFCIAEHKEQEQKRWIDMTEIQPHVVEIREEDEESEDDL